MVPIRTILTLSIAILAVDNVVVEAGKATNYRENNLVTRAEAHKETLRGKQKELEQKFGTMTDPVKDQLTEINYIIIDHILENKSFPKYLKNVFEVLQQYAERQIKKRLEKLKKVYKKWQKQNFPDKEKKSKALKILQKQEKENKSLLKRNKKNEKKQSSAKNTDKKPTDKHGSKNKTK